MKIAEPRFLALFIVHRHELQEVLNNYPEYMSRFRDEISRDLTFNLREGSEVDVSTI